MCKDYVLNGGSLDVKGGFVGNIVVNSGNVTIHGGVVDNMNLNNSNLAQVGGIMTVKENKGFVVGGRDDLRKAQGKIELLNEKIRRANGEILRLRNENEEFRKAKESRERKTACNDDVVERLKKQLADERNRHEKEVAVLKENLDGVLEVNENLRRHIEYLIGGVYTNEAIRQRYSPSFWDKQWDDYKPTKEECMRVYRQFRIFMDCED